MKKKRLVMTMLLWYAILMLLVTVVCREWGGVHAVHFNPFWHYKQALPADIKDVVINMLMFVPIGTMLRAMKHPRFSKFGFVVLACFCFSVFIEVMQWVLACGSCDIDDVIHNTFGGAMGLWGWNTLSIVMRYSTRKWRGTGVMTGA